MKIGVMSDTHLHHPNEVLEFILTTLFADTDMILHAGDITGHRVLDRLGESEVLAVCGNMDDYEIADSVPHKRIIEIEGRRIGLMHGWGSRHGLEERIIERFSEDKPDIIVYGHSHEPFWGTVGGVAMFNPGSAGQNRGSSGATVGVLDLQSESVMASFIDLRMEFSKR